MEGSSNPSEEQKEDEKSFFVNSDGLKIHCKYWYPNDQQALR